MTELKFVKRSKAQKIAERTAAVQEVQPELEEPVRTLIFRAKSRPERRSFTNAFKNDSGWKWGLTPKELTKRLAKMHKKAEEHIVLIDDACNDNRTSTIQRAELKELRKYFVMVMEVTPGKKPANKSIN